MAEPDWNPDTGGRSLAEILREANIESATRAARRRSWDDPEETGIRQRRAEAAAADKAGFARRRSDLEDAPPPRDPQIEHVIYPVFQAKYLVERTIRPSPLMRAMAASWACNCPPASAPVIR